MEIQTSRFGSVGVSDDQLIQFERGLFGFPSDRRFVLIPHGSSQVIAWLQSADSPNLAFPVVSAHALGRDYPDVDLGAIIDKAGLRLELDRLAVLVVLCAPRDQPATVNLLAPVLVDAEQRAGVQVFLEGSRYGTRELFVVPAPTQATVEGAAGTAPERPVEREGAEGPEAQSVEA